VKKKLPFEQYLFKICFYPNHFLFFSPLIFSPLNPLKGTSGRQILLHDYHLLSYFFLWTEVTDHLFPAPTLIHHQMPEPLQGCGVKRFGMKINQPFNELCLQFMLKKSVFQILPYFFTPKSPEGDLPKATIVS
jgi:hypothetical protein